MTIDFLVCLSHFSFLFRFIFYYFIIVSFYNYAGYSNGYTSGFLGFSVYVSNTTDRKHGTLCFKDDTFTRATIPAIFTTTCPLNGQYIIYYNERVPGLPYSEEFSEYAYSDLCELEVLHVGRLFLKSITICLTIQFYNSLK